MRVGLEYSCRARVRGVTQCFYVLCNCDICKKRAWDCYNTEARQAAREEMREKQRTKRFTSAMPA